MDLTPYVENLRQDLAVAAEAGGDDARALAERLVAPLDSAVRLALLDALSTAAGEITRDLAPGSVELRLRGREPSFVVTLPPTEHTFEDEPPVQAPSAVTDADEGTTARINFRLSENLKGRIEEAAGVAGLSVNAWLIRAASAALTPDDRGARTERRNAWGGQRQTGWVH